MNVLLISANSMTSPYPVYPLGLDYVAAAVAKSHTVEILDANICDEQALIQTLKRFQPDAVGLSIRNIDNTDSSNPKGFIVKYQDWVRTIRKHSRSPLVLGGSGFTIFPGELMAALDADFGMIGEGERFPLLLQAIEKGTDGTDIPGVCSRNHRTAIPKALEKSFQRRFEPDSPQISYYLKHGGMLNLQTKRGCQYRCIYCSYPHIEGRVLRYTPPEVVADMALKLQQAGARYLFITDSVFNSDFDHSRAVAEAFLKVNLSIPWGAFFKPIQPPKNYYRILANAGLTHVEFGTESLSDSVLKAYRKPFDVNQILQAHQLVKDAGLHVAHYFLLGGPGETPETLEETLYNIDKLDQSVLFFFCGMRIYPYTELHDLAVREGQVSKHQNLLEPVFYQNGHINSEDILRRVRDHAGDRSHWIVGSGGAMTERILERMYKRGHTGPLWEQLCRG